MDSHLSVLIISAISLGFIHTALGPDHYIPFIALAKSQNWSKLKTAWITIISGIGHVLSSVLIGLFGYMIGEKVFSLESIESVRAGIAGWSLVVFGLLYTIWGIKKSFSNNSHSHSHIHINGIKHTHIHTHNSHEHKHIHNNEKKKCYRMDCFYNISFWSVRTINSFADLPCS
jgi:ABC-type nickel/cobalt efflux system permease component RcnA